MERERVVEEQMQRRVRAKLEKERQQGVGLDDEDSENQAAYNAENDIGDSDAVYEEV